MNISDILNRVDHTLLAVDSTPKQIAALCDDGILYKTASICIPPCYVGYAKEYTQGKIAVCTVTGFPNGYMSSQAKALESADAVKNGADEIDTVINIGMLKTGNEDYITEELKRIKDACSGKLLKVIIETCLLTEDEKKIMCDIVTKVGADYIKTSTGFSTGGATVEDIKLFKRCVGSHVKIKAAGGIKTLADAEALINAGASRLGTSRIVAIAKSEAVQGEY